MSDYMTVSLEQTISSEMRSCLELKRRVSENVTLIDRNEFMKSGKYASKINVSKSHNNSICQFNS